MKKESIFLDKGSNKVGPAIVTFYDEFLVSVGVGNDWGLDDRPLHLIEGIVLSITPASSTSVWVKVSLQSNVLT